MSGRGKRTLDHVSGSGSVSPSMVSVKSGRSLDVPPNLAAEKPQSSQMSSGDSVSPSAVSLKSDRSMDVPLNLAAEKPQSSQMSSGESKSPSVVFKSDSSMDVPPNINTEKPLNEPAGAPLSCPVCQETLGNLVHLDCGHLSCDQCSSSDQCPKCGKKPRKHLKSSEEDDVLKEKKAFQEEMLKKFAWTSEGNGDKQSLLETVYTDQYIVPGESTELPEEHEMCHLERKQKVLQSSKGRINNNDIFRPLPGLETVQRMVLTKGNTGIGKSFSVQKFILDWAKGEANQDIDFVFYLPFREMNLCTGKKTLHDLLTDFHPVLARLRTPTIYLKTKVIVILDSLDESRLVFDFKKTQTITSLNELTSLEVLLVNLIQGNLLSEAKVWITTRPAMASQIPAKNIHLVTEIRGFNEAQKKQYFTKKFSKKPDLTDRIILHIESSHTLNIMCQIPIFCWMSAVLFQDVFDENKKIEIPQTLTEMLAHYVSIQTKRTCRKNGHSPQKDFLRSQREPLMKLGKLAFVHLQKKSLIFYEDDMAECDITVDEASIYSGFVTTVHREEDFFSQRKIFFFIHLTIQEFFAAMYVYDCLTNTATSESDKTVILKFLDLKDEADSLLKHLKITVDIVMKKGNCYLTFFLRFLMGLLVEDNRRVIHGLLRNPDPSQDTEKKVLTYLKSIRRKSMSPENSIVLFRTMVEMRDHRVKDEVQEYLRSQDPDMKLSPLQCSALAYILQVSKDDLNLLDLRSYNTNEEGRRRLIPAVKSSKKAILADCNVTPEWVERLSTSLSFPHSPLQDLNLSHNDLLDSGVEILCRGLSSLCCQLEILRLSGCMITESGCSSLASALGSNPSHLKELDLSYNHPGEAGIKLLTQLKTDSQYQLSTFHFDHCGSQRLKPGFKKYACEPSFDPSSADQNLLLSEGNSKVSWVTAERGRSTVPQKLLCQQDLQQRCYWEMEVEEPFNVGASYRTRAGELGRDLQSWSLVCSDRGCYVLHGGAETGVPSLLCQRSNRVGVLLDWASGTLSFYRVSAEQRVLLFTFDETFTEPLVPAVQLHEFPSSARFCRLY